MKKKAKIKTNAVRMVEKTKIPYQLHEYPWSEDHLDAFHVGQEMGVSLQQVYKTIVLQGDRVPYLVVCIAADKEVDLKKVAKVSGNKRVELLPLSDLEKVTGYVRGGCSPVGMKKHFPTYIESSAKDQPSIRISAGKRGIQMEINPLQLAELTNATWFDN